MNDAIAKVNLITLTYFFKVKNLKFIISETVIASATCDYECKYLAFLAIF